MLKIEDITYNVEGRPLFEGASATIPTGHKVGLVGRNGAGKTTLFRLIRGELALRGVRYPIQWIFPSAPHPTSGRISSRSSRAFPRV